MRIGLKALPLAAVITAGLLVTQHIAKAQTPAYRAPRTADGKPNLNGIWQALNEANWDLEPHAAYQGSLLAEGAQFSVPPSPGVVDGGAIPYKPEALAKKKENFASRAKNDPEVKCYMGGVPRSTYMPYPFQIIQGTGTIMMAYEFAGGVRTINMGKPTEAPVDSWMGWSNGHWEGETLVVDVTGLMGSTRTRCLRARKSSWKVIRQKTAPTAPWGPISHMPPTERDSSSAVRLPERTAAERIRRPLAG
jgi:hypothetical protein